MECPLCKQSHEKNFEALALTHYCFTKERKKVDHFEYFKVLCCRKCGIMFQVLNDEAKKFWEQIRPKALDPDGEEYQI